MSFNLKVPFQYFIGGMILGYAASVLIPSPSEAKVISKKNGTKVISPPSTSAKKSTKKSQLKTQKKKPAKKVTKKGKKKQGSGIAANSKAKGVSAPLVIQAASPQAEKVQTTSPAISKKPCSFSFNSARLAQVSLFQSTKDASYSFMGIWDPSYQYDSRASFRLDVGVSLLNGKSQKFVMVQEVLMAAYRLTDRWSMEVGPGAQQWINYGGWKFITAMQGVYHLPKNWIEKIDRLWVGYTSIFDSEVHGHQISLGVAAKF